MKFSENWLRGWINTTAPLTEWAQKLTAAGIEVEEIIPLGADLNNICVGYVLSANQHPDADRLRVCEVTINENEPPLTIVCGAPNARAGLKVAVAQVGAVLPGDFKIKKSKIRGVESCGMLCSSKELGLGDTQDGIMELPEDAPIGMSFTEYFNLPDQILDIGLTPNRGDCLSVAGLARELHAVSGWDFSAAPDNPPSPLSAGTADLMPVNLQASEACPRYVGRVIKNINPHAKTPLWIQQRLQRCNIRIIHPVVDIMNYVMLELGQPLHAFDLKTIKEKIDIRHSNVGETVTLLDTKTLTLEKPALVIADAEKILALAGIMGGASSAVTTTTTDIFIESAFFTPQAIQPTLRRYILQSDAAHRFERGVDPALPMLAMQRASALVLEICGGDAGDTIEKIDTAYLPTPKTIQLRLARIERILGMTLETQQIENFLKRLNCSVEKNKDSWEVTPPSYRFDLNSEIDLIEEVARLYGYENIPAKPMQAELRMQPLPEDRLTLTRIRNTLVDQGYNEAINYSFIDPKLAALFNPYMQGLALSNPISVDLSVMRTTLLPGLIQAALFNLNRQQIQLRLFEIGTCFLAAGTAGGFPSHSDIQHVPYIAGIAAGPAFPIQWGIPNQALDFFNIKGDLENLFALTGDKASFSFVPTNYPILHPGRGAEIQRAGKKIGYVGELHPALQTTLDLPLPVYLFEINLESLLPACLPAYHAPSKYPSTRRDLAFIVKNDVLYQQIYEAIYFYAKKGLQSVQLFDIYTGTGIPSGHKSLALSLTFQLDSRTLTDEEVDKTMQQVMNGLMERFEAVLRE